MVVDLECSQYFFERMREIQEVFGGALVYFHLKISGLGLNSTELDNYHHIINPPFVEGYREIGWALAVEDMD